MTKITSEQYRQMMDELVIEFLKTASIEERHQLVSEWNYRSQGGINIQRWIANDPNTDKATALMLYWKRLPAPWYLKTYANRDEVHWTELDDFDLMEKIENFYLSGLYQNHSFAFDPSSNGGNDGIDWTIKPSWIEAKREIPAIMFEKLMGREVPCSKDFDEGVPPHVWEEMKKYEVSG